MTNETKTANISSLFRAFGRLINRETARAAKAMQGMRTELNAKDEESFEHTHIRFIRHCDPTSDAHCTFWEEMIDGAAEAFGPEMGYDLASHADRCTPTNGLLNVAAYKKMVLLSERWMDSALSGQDPREVRRACRAYSATRDPCNLDHCTDWANRFDAAVETFGDSFGFYLVQFSIDACFPDSPLQRTILRSAASLAQTVMDKAIMERAALPNDAQDAGAKTEDLEDTLTRAHRYFVKYHLSYHPNDRKTWEDILDRAAKAFGPKVGYDMAKTVYNEIPRGGRVRDAAKEAMFAQSCSILHTAINAKDEKMLHGAYINALHSCNQYNQVQCDRLMVGLNRALQAFPARATLDLLSVTQAKVWEGSALQQDFGTLLDRLVVAPASAARKTAPAVAAQGATL